jgi:hypothetical protein
MDADGLKKLFKPFGIERMFGGYGVYAEACASWSNRAAKFS